jgi:hypothetical protein
MLAPANMKNKLSSKKPLSLAILVVLVLLVAAAVFLIFHKQPNQYKYHQLDTYTLDSGVNGSNLVFQKPIEANQIANSRASVSIYHALPNNRLASYFSAGITPLLQPLPSSDLTGFNTTLAKPSDKYYGPTVASIKLFTQRSLPANTVLSFGNAQKFTNTHISKDAWKFDYTGNIPENKTKHYTGQAIFAVSKGGYYYFSFYAPDANWGYNKATWQKVLDGLQIDK